MIIKNVRVDWLFVFEPGNKGKYGCCVILEKGSPQAKQVRAEVDKKIAQGIANGKFTEANTKSKTFKGCLRDGDQEILEEDRPKHYANSEFFNCSNNNQPGIVGPDLNPLMSKDTLYSGCYCNVDVNFSPFNNESKGVGAYLNNIMLVKEGDRLDGRQSADTAFAGLETDDNLQ